MFTKIKRTKLNYVKYIYKGRYVSIVVFVYVYIVSKVYSSNSTIGNGQCLRSIYVCTVAGIILYIQNEW